VAVLARRVGVRHIELVEDAVQSALMSALTAWTQQQFRPPQNSRTRRCGFSEETGHPTNLLYRDEIRDDMLRMLFVCCDDGMPRESQLVLALKTLCGFSTEEIALRLFTSAANVHKRLGRARDRLRQTLPEVETPSLEKLRPTSRAALGSAPTDAVRELLRRRLAALD
jgi:RNA polymerase sigma-70 factor (ECF subfamily)